MRWIAERTHINNDHERLLTVVIYAEHETNEHVRRDNVNRKHNRELVKI